MTFGDHLDDLARATGFLSRLPVPARFFKDHDGSLARAAGMFPLAGLAIGLGSGLVILALSWTGANPALTALIALITLTGLTGALHEDGLADSADALGARGGREHSLEIMKDSRIGAYGVLALLSAFSLKAVALTIVITVTGGWTALLLVCASAAISRTAMIWHWTRLPAARPGGVASSVGVPEEAAAKFAYALGGASFLILVAVSFGLIAALVSFVLIAAATQRWTALVRERIGGYTGDTLGATQQIAETVCLTTLALLL